jgi:hypothetical protein
VRFLVLELALAGCPELDTKPVSATCVKQYEKCKLPNGPLGVCDTAPCKAGEPGPCFKCNPQH